MFVVFDDVSQGKYSKTVVIDEGDSRGILEFKDNQPIAKGKRLLSFLHQFVIHLLHLF